MGAENHKRFRKRGGAKKKKKQNNEDGTVPPLDRPQPQSEDFRDSTENANYFSGFALHSHSSGRLDSDLQSYLDKLQASLEEVDPGAAAALAYVPDGDDPPPSVLLSRNALMEVAPRLPEISRDNNAARFIEVLLRAAHDSDVLCTALEALLSTGPSRVADLAAHRCASHVLETLLECMRKVGASPDPLIPIVSEWSAAEIKEVISSPSGSHVFRAIVAAFSGLPTGEPREAKLDDSTPGQMTTYLHNCVPVSDESLSAVKTITATLLNGDARMQDLVWPPASSAALQGLLSAVTIADKSVAKKVGMECLKAGFSSLINDSSGCRFLERLILCVGTSCVSDNVKGHFLELSRHPKGNYVMQRYLLGMKGRGAVMSAWDELEDAIPSMLGFGKVREGVVLSLLRVTEVEGDENCRRRASRAIGRACGAVGSKARSLAGILFMGSEDVWNRWKKTVDEMQYTGFGLYGRSGDVLRVQGRLMKGSLLGTLIARCLMRFSGGPGQSARDSLAGLSGCELIALIADACGSRLVEQWIQDEDVKRATKIASKVFSVIWDVGGDQSVLAVARNPYGAMVLVRCCALLEGLQRRQLMDALASGCENLKMHDSGQIVIRKCRVEQYIRKGDQWEREESTKLTKQRLFADILQDGDEDEAQPGDAKERERKRAHEKTRKKDTFTKPEKKRKRSLEKEPDVADSPRTETENGFPTTSEKCTDNNVASESISVAHDSGRETKPAELDSVLNAIATAAKPMKKKKKSKKERRNKLESVK